MKSPNVILAADGRVRLVDFEFAHELGVRTRAVGHGTRGYVSPQQAAEDPPAVTDDVYGLGAVLYFAATGAEPSQAPAVTLMDRPPELLNPALSPALGQVIRRCLEPEPGDRFESMSEVEEALTRGDVSAAATDETEERGSWRDMAARLASTLADVATPAPGGAGLVWVTSHPTGAGALSRSLNMGSGGTLLAAAELVAELGGEALSNILAEGARWLAAAPRPDGDVVPGLYVGEAGVAAALLRAGQVLGDDELVRAASERGRDIAALPHVSPDLFNGTAGRLRFHLFLWDETRDDPSLADAVACGESLLSVAEKLPGGGLRWRIPEGYAGLSGSACLGYSHGAAGIADALLDLFEVTGEERYRAAAEGALRWLSGLGVPVLDDRSGLDWPTTEDGKLFGALWCHGAAGICRFLIHAAKLELVPEAGELAARAARAAAIGARAAGPTQCHGLAGNIEVLLDQFQATGETQWLDEAGVLGELLRAFARERDGRLVFPSELPFVVSPDYMVGFAGVATCLLRLSDPSLPHVLSRRGFQRRSAATVV
jgi:hypothetical protein